MVAKSLMFSIAFMSKTVGFPFKKSFSSKFAELLLLSPAYSKPANPEVTTFFTASLG
jgi:hypothetical protein